MAGDARERLCFFFVSILALLYSSSLSAQPITKDACLGCHSAPGLEKLRDGKKVSLQIEPQAWGKSIHGAFDCTTCHTDISQIPHKAELKPVQCETCHAASVKSYSESIHAQARA